MQQPTVPSSVYVQQPEVTRLRIQQPAVTRRFQMQQPAAVVYPMVSTLFFCMCFFIRTCLLTLACAVAKHHSVHHDQSMCRMTEVHPYHTIPWVTLTIAKT